MQQGPPQQQQQYGQINYNQTGRPGPYLQPPAQSGGYPWANQQQQGQQDPSSQNNSNQNIYRSLPPSSSNSFPPYEDYSRGGQSSASSPAGPYNETIRYDNSGNMQDGGLESLPVVSQAQYNELYNQNYPQQGQQQGYDRQSNGNEQYGSGSSSSGGGYFYPDSATGASGGSSGENYGAGRRNVDQQAGANQYGQGGVPAYDDNPSQTSYPDQAQGGQRDWQQQQARQQQQWQQTGNDSGSGFGSNSGSGPIPPNQRMISPTVDAGSRGSQRQGGVSERVEDWE